MARTLPWSSHSAREHQAFAEGVRRFAEDEFAAGASERAHSPHYSWNTAALPAEPGLPGIPFSEEDGGPLLMHAESARP